MTPHRAPAKLPIVIGLGTGQTLAFGTTLYLPAILAEPMAIELGIPPGWAFGAFSLALIFAALLGLNLIYIAVFVYHLWGALFLLFSTI